MGKIFFTSDLHFEHKLATFLLSFLLLIYTFFSLIYGFYLVFTEKEEIEKMEKKCRK